MIEFKQKELVNKLFKQVKEKFPEIEFIDVMESPEDPNDLWVRITKPNDEDREIELTEFASELEMDILMDYGCQILIMPTSNHNSTSTEIKI